MSLHAKSIHAAVSPDDGIRICVMRKPDQEHDYDIWMRRLAPPRELLKSYQNQEIEWDEFKGKFDEAVIQKQGELLDILTDIASKRKVTLLCVEETPHACHRRLVAEACAARNPELEVVISE